MPEARLNDPEPPDVEVDEDQYDQGPEDEAARSHVKPKPVAASEKPAKPLSPPSAKFLKIQAAWMAKRAAEKAARGDTYRRRVIRYAKAEKGRHPAHPLVAGFPLESALRHLANDPENGSSVRDLAKIALTGGPEADSGHVTHALWMLSDALGEHENANGSIGHPAAGWYNWMAAADKVQLDAHTHRAFSEMAEDYRRTSPQTSPNEWMGRPEGHINHAYSALNPHHDRGQLSVQDERNALARARQRVAELAPGTPQKAIDELIRRHAMRASYIYKKETGLDTTNVEDAARKSHKETGLSSKVLRTSQSAKNDLASRYKRRPIRYGGLSEAMGEDLASVRAGAQKIGGAIRTGIGKLKDAYRGMPGIPGADIAKAELERRFPWLVRRSRRKYALNARGDFIDALRRVRSAQAQAIKKSAQEIARRLGLDPSSTVDALHDGPQGATPGVAQAIYGYAKPEDVHAGAAWLGLVNNGPGMAVFHVRPTGPDRLYRFRQAGSGLELRAKLDRHGLTNRVLIPHRRGYDVILPDPGHQLAGKVQEYGKTHGVEVQASTGHFRVMGDQDRSRAREIFRNAVVKSEKMARPKRYAKIGFYPKQLNHAVRTLGIALATSLRSVGKNPAGRAELTQRLTVGQNPYMLRGPGRVTHTPLHPDLQLAVIRPQDAAGHAADTYGGLIDRLHGAGELTDRHHRLLKVQSEKLRTLKPWTELGPMPDNAIVPKVAEKKPAGRDPMPFRRRLIARHSNQSTGGN